MTIPGSTALDRAVREVEREREVLEASHEALVAKLNAILAVCEQHGWRDAPVREWLARELAELARYREERRAVAGRGGV